MPTDNAESSALPARWAVLELLGHRKVAGAISEQTLAGAHLVRVDVPEVTYETDVNDNGRWQRVKRTIPAHTCSYGGGAINGVQWVDEATALLIAHQLRSMPISTFQLRDALANLSPGDRHALLQFDPAVGGA